MKVKHQICDEQRKSEFTLWSETQIYLYRKEQIFHSRVLTNLLLNMSRQIDAYQNFFANIKIERMQAGDKRK